MLRSFVGAVYKYGGSTFLLSLPTGVLSLFQRHFLFSLSRAVFRAALQLTERLEEARATSTPLYHGGGMRYVLVFVLPRVKLPLLDSIVLHS